MPQAVDLPVSPGRSSKQVARANRTSEPTSRFDDILSKRSRPERSPQSDSSRESQKTASAKSGRSDEDDRAEASDKVQKKSKPEKPERDRVEDSDDPAPESESAGAEETSEAPIAEAPANDESAVLEGVVEDKEETPADASTDEPTEAVDPALAALAVAPGAGKAASDVVPDSETPVDDATASVDPLDLSKLTAKPVADANATAKPAQASEGESVDDAADAGVQASGLKIPEAAADADTSEADALAQTAQTTPDAAAPAHAASSAPAESDVDPSVQVQPATQSKSVAPAAPIAQPQAVQHPDDHFVEQNVDRIVTGIKSDLTPNGGTMKIRLDPPNLGQLNIDVTIDEGVLTASFTTTNEEATRLLSHSMQQLKHTLEGAGVSVDKIQVRQTSPSEQSSNSRSGDQDQQQQQNAHDHPQRQEQQRREALQKMWAKLALGEEPLDLVA